MDFCFCLHRHLTWWSDKYANMINGTGMYSENAEKVLFHFQVTKFHV